jgi:hypothetical protein
MKSLLNLRNSLFEEEEEEEEALHAPRDSNSSTFRKCTILLIPSGVAMTNTYTSGLC